MKAASLVSGGAWLLLVASNAWAARDGGIPGTGHVCDTSTDCSRPTPHCHPSRNECVECLTDRNCAAGLLCDEASGACTECGTDADCPADRPYCTTRECVQCRTDANCGQGVTCNAGRCGSCGDGVCHLSEGILNVVPDFPLSMCRDDCASSCPSIELGVNETRRLVFTRNLYEAGCGDSEGMNDVTVSFTPPKDNYYRLEIEADLPEADISILRIDGCTGVPNGCSSLFRGSMIVSAPQVGGSLTLVIETDSARSVELRIVEDDPICRENCGPLEPPPIDAGKPSEDERARCLSRATERGDRSCEGVSCACAECPIAYEGCAAAAGCDEVLACMQDKRCAGVECYTGGACRRLIDDRGGISGDAFRAAAELEACALTHLCALPCATTDAGAPPAVPGTLCNPGQKVACSCGEGGTGAKRCNDDGEVFGECVCSQAGVASADSSSCDCHLGRRTGGPAGGFAVLSGLIAALAGHRRLSRRATWRRR